MHQKKSSNLVDLMTPADQERVKAIAEKRDQERSKLITREWLGLSELGFYYGWEAVRDVIDDVITLEQANMFVEGARKLHSGHVYDNSISSMAAKATKPSIFEKLMKRYITDMRAVQ